MAFAWRTIRVRCQPTAVTLLACALIGLWFANGADADEEVAKPVIYGAYAVTVAGDHSGKGNAAVSAAGVTINVQLVDADGNKGHMVATNLPLEKGRFFGTATMFGESVKISGRVDPPGSTIVDKPRLVATYVTDSGKAGRLVGVRRGGGKGKVTTARRSTGRDPQALASVRMSVHLPFMIRSD